MALVKVRADSGSSLSGACKVGGVGVWGRWVGNICASDGFKLAFC